MHYKHVPVLLSEVMELLDPRPGQNYIDCTMGGGGYTLAIAERIRPGKIISIDLDQSAINNLRTVIAKNQNKYQNIIIVNDNFKNLQYIYNEQIEKEEIGYLDGIVLDLGLSSAQLQDPNRGFSFQVDAPLDMTFGQTADSLSAEDILNNSKQVELEKIIKDYGEEKFYRTIARKIIDYRRKNCIKTTGQLLDIIRQATPPRYRFDSKIHFATRTFQALRIAVNQELDNLNQVLPQAIDILRPGGKIAVVSYHSLEDRIVKNFFRHESKDCLCPPQQPVCSCTHQARLMIINRKIITPTADEITNNPRSRSAKLRVAQKS